MIKVLTHTALMVLFSATALAGYLPPKENVAYWCYQGCIDDHYSNHNECVPKCYGGGRAKSNPIQIQNLNQNYNQNQNCQDNTYAAEIKAAACCSWGENIQGCMPGC